MGVRGTAARPLVRRRGRWGRTTRVGVSLAALVLCALLVAPGTGATAGKLASLWTATGGGSFITAVGPDLAITKTHGADFHRGQTGATYTITVANVGSSPTTAPVSVTDALPLGLTATGIIGKDWACVLLTCTRDDVLPAGELYPSITVTVDVGLNADPSVTNSATVTTADDPNAANDTADDPTTIAGLPDLTVAKSHTGDFHQGQSGAQYTITVTNSGNGATTGQVSVTDTLPPGLSASDVSGSGWSCTLDTLTCTRSNSLAASDSYPAITVTVDVSANADPSVINRATVSTVGDSNASNDTASDTTSVTRPDLAIAKTHAGNFHQGQTGAQYTITVTNSGTGPTTGQVSVTDTLPVGLAATAVNGVGWSCSLGPATCSRNDSLDAGQSYEDIIVTVDVAADAPASRTNQASVSGGNDADTTNNTATDPTTITSPDLTIAKDHTGNFQQGQTGATYTITVTNSGNGPTAGEVSVTDTLPLGLTASAISGTGWSCDLTTVACTRSDTLGAGGDYPVITVTVNVANDAAASRTNQASVSGGNDSDTTNNTATDPTTITRPDLTIAKTHTGNFHQGQTAATYTITVTNSGTGPTTGTVTVTDTLPLGLAATAISGTGWTCTLGTLTCTRSTSLGAGNAYPAITVTITVSASAAASLTNTATVSGGHDADTTNNTADDLTTITPVDSVRPSVTVNQAASQADPTPAGPIRFTATFSEPVSGFTSADVTLAGTSTGTTAVVAQVAPNDGTTYEISVSGMTANGTVKASIPASAAADGSSNGNIASTSTDNTVTYANARPTIAVAGGSACTASGAGGTMRLTVGDAETPADALILTAASSDTRIIPNTGLVLGGTGADRTITITPSSGRRGQVTVGVWVGDGGSVSTAAAIVVIVGGSAGDTLNGTPGADLLLGLGGGDRLAGAGGNDLVCGGGGADTALGGGGDDVLDGGSGNDNLQGGAMNDLLTGSAGADRFSGGTGVDVATDLNPADGDTSDGTIP